MLYKLRSTRAAKIALLVRKSLFWAGLYISQSGLLAGQRRTSTSRAWVMKDAHTIEKGLAFREMRPWFGADKRRRLIENMAAVSSTNEDDPSVEIATSVLADYRNKHAAFDDPDLDALKQIDAVLEKSGGKAINSAVGGTAPYRRDYSPEETEAFKRVVTTRRSLRNFSNEEVSDELILEAIRLAQMGPSVCNRQPWSVSIVRNRSLIRQILKFQGGAKGFSEGIGCLLVVQANLDEFLEEYELFEPYVDGGIFAGGLVNALNSLNVGSCCLNLCHSHQKIRGIVKLLGLPKSIQPILLVACGYPEQGAHTALSTRLPIRSRTFS